MIKIRKSVYGTCADATLLTIMMNAAAPGGALPRRLRNRFPHSLSCPAVL
jgi:hypothetical protein